MVARHNRRVFGKTAKGRKSRTHFSPAISVQVNHIVNERVLAPAYLVVQLQVHPVIRLLSLPLHSSLSHRGIEP